MWLGGEGQFFNKLLWTGDEGRNLRMCFWTGGCKLLPSSFGLGRLHVFAKRLWSECAFFFYVRQVLFGGVLQVFTKYFGAGGQGRIFTEYFWAEGVWKFR